MKFDDFLKQYQNRISSYLHDILPAEENNILHQAMRYSVLNGGKRLRPILVYATGLTLNANPQNLDIPATAVELIHCYSLIHDDLPAMDNADLRRDKPTCHKRFNEAVAILAGDALQALSFAILSRNNQMSSILSQACLRMAEGQAQDITNQTTISLEKLNHINQLKTGALIEASVLLGAISANCKDKKILDELKKYTQNIGLAFQIHDDILDIESTTKALGKPTQSDQTLDKITYPALIGIKQAKQKLQQLHQQAIECLSKINLENSLLADLANFVITRCR